MKKEKDEKKYRVHADISERMYKEFKKYLIEIGMNTKEFIIFKIVEMIGEEDTWEY